MGTKSNVIPFPACSASKNTLALDLDILETMSYEDKMASIERNANLLMRVSYENAREFAQLNNDLEVMLASSELRHSRVIQKKNKALMALRNEIHKLKDSLR